jgi:hypothetical protein
MKCVGLKNTVICDASTVVSFINVSWDFVPCSCSSTNVLENIPPLSSGFLRVIGLHSCVTVESLLISLSIEGYYVWSKSTVFWDAFTAVSVIEEGIIITNFM